MGNETYDDILKKSTKKPLKFKKFKKFFNPIKLSDGYMLENLKDARDLANKFIKKNNLQTKLRQHIWTVVYGKSDKLFIFNGNHIFDIVGYVVCKTPWGDGTKKIIIFSSNQNFKETI